MHKIRYALIVLGMLLSLATSASAGISIGIGLPSVSIGINLPLFPELVPIPGYPVYYAPGFSGNYFFYDGMYWVYQNDNWYASSWYNGPWGFVEPTVVPLFILRVPVSYYRQPPAYFSGWQSNAPPRWGDHWGRNWEQRRGGWDRWNRSSAPERAPLPVYQRQYAGDRYPKVEQQKVLRTQQYRYQPREKVVRQHLKQVEKQAPAAQRVRQEKPQTRTPQREMQHSAPEQQGVPAGRTQPPNRGGENVQRPAPAQPQHQRGQSPREQRVLQPAAQPQPPQQQQRGQAPREQRQQQPATQREQHAPQGQPQGHGKGQPQPQGEGQGQHERGGGQEQDRGHGQGEGRGR